MPTDQVDDVEDVEEVPEEGTPQDEGVADNATPETPEFDVEKLKAEYEQKLQTSQQDLNKLKSSLQKQQAEQAKKYQEEQARLEKQLREVRMQNMDEDQRKQYEAQMQSEEYQNLQAQLQERDRVLADQAATLDALNFFASKKVPVDSLVLNQGYDALAQSGWDYISNRLTELEAQVSNPKPEPKPRKKAPDVLTDKSSPSKGSSWKELRAKYGTDENIYQAIEDGTLSPSILPGL